MDANEAFENLAAEFRRETGMLAPGKDWPELGGPPPEDREEKWKAFLKRRRDL